MPGPLAHTCETGKQCTCKGISSVNVTRVKYFNLKRMGLLGIYIFPVINPGGFVSALGFFWIWLVGDMF